MSYRTPQGDHLGRAELRASVLQRLETFTERVEWVGEGADRAFADSFLALVDWLIIGDRLDRQADR